MSSMSKTKTSQGPMSAYRRSTRKQPPPSVLELATVNNGDSTDEDDQPISRLVQRTSRKEPTKGSGRASESVSSNEEPLDEEEASTNTNGDADHSSDEDFKDNNDSNDSKTSSSGNHSNEDVELDERRNRHPASTESKKGTEKRKANAKHASSAMKYRRVIHEASDNEESDTRSMNDATSTVNVNGTISITAKGPGTGRIVGKSSANANNKTTVHVSQTPRIDISQTGSSRKVRSSRKTRTILDSSDDENGNDGDSLDTQLDCNASTNLPVTTLTSLARMTSNERDATGSNALRQTRQRKSRRSVNAIHSDDDYVDGSSNDDDSDAEYDDKRPLTVAATSKSIGIVREGDIGSADEDSDDSNKVVFRSPQLDVQPLPMNSLTARKGTNPFYDDSDDSSSHRGLTDSRLSVPSSRQQHRSPIAICGNCTSRTDVVTEEDLPKMHVCFFPPDGQHRQCFALKTLRQIALSAQLPRFRTDQTGSPTQTFLQPPHFRTNMSDDLLDQIASRFGREALDIHGPYYTRQKEDKAAGAAAGDLWSTGQLHQQTAASVPPNNEAFLQQLERYIKNRMGSQDLYCCPICYIAAHKQLMADSNEEDNDDPVNSPVGRNKSDGPIENAYPTEFSFDPMTVLGYIDNDSFRIASTFCFTKVSSLKDHLRRDHGVDTKKVKGNDVYVRYKIRAQDGLLQRFLTRSTGRWGPTRQGEMLSYWFHGNNSSFVLLLSLVSHAAICRSIVNTSVDIQSDAEGVEMAEDYLLGTADFYESFVDDVFALWDVVTSPFSNEEIGDFVLEDDDEMPVEDNDLMMHRALNMEAELEELRNTREEADEYVARYERYDRRHGSDDENREENEGASDDDVANGGNFDDSTEEEDDWEKSILNKRVARQRSGDLRNRRRRVESTSNDASIGANVPPNQRDAGTISRPLALSSDEEIAIVVPKSHRRKSLVILDSDDDK